MGVATLTICLSIVGLNPVGDTAKDSVDLFEVNHYYDESGRFIFKQLIFYDWCPKQCRFNVRAWRLIRSTGQLPTLDRRKKKYVAVWQDGSKFRRVQAKNMRQTWTQFDPEQFERKFLPKDKRVELVGKFGRKKR